MPYFSRFSLWIIARSSETEYATRYLALRNFNRMGSAIAASSPGMLIASGIWAASNWEGSRKSITMQSGVGLIARKSANVTVGNLRGSGLFATGEKICFSVSPLCVANDTRLKTRITISKFASLALLSDSVFIRPRSNGLSHPCNSEKLSRQMIFQAECILKS